jgi:hypothetical protein
MPPGRDNDPKKESAMSISQTTGVDLSGAVRTKPGCDLGVAEVLLGLKDLERVSEVTAIIQGVISRFTPENTWLNLPAMEQAAKEIRAELDRKKPHDQETHLELIDHDFLDELWKDRHDGDAGAIIAVRVAFVLHERDFHKQASKNAHPEIAKEILESVRAVASRRPPLTKPMPFLITFIHVLITLELKTRASQRSLRVERAGLRRTIPLSQSGPYQPKSPAAESDAIDISHSGSTTVQDSTAVCPHREAKERRGRLKQIEKALERRNKRHLKGRGLKREAQWYWIVHEADRRDESNSETQLLLVNASCTWRLEGTSFCDKLLKVRRQTYRWVGVAVCPGPYTRDLVMLARDLVLIPDSQQLVAGAVSDRAAVTHRRDGLDGLARNVDVVARFIAAEWSKAPDKRHCGLIARLSALSQTGHWSEQRYPALFPARNKRLDPLTTLPWHGYWETVRLDAIKGVLRQIKSSGTDFPRSEEFS